MSSPEAPPRPQAPAPTPPGANPEGVVQPVPPTVRPETVPAGDPYGGIFVDALKTLENGEAKIVTPWMSVEPAEKHSRPRQWADTTVSKLHLGRRKEEDPRLGHQRLGHRVLTTLIDSGPLGIPVDMVRNRRTVKRNTHAPQTGETDYDTPAARRLAADIAYQKGFHDRRIEGEVAMAERERAHLRKEQDRAAAEAAGRYEPTEAEKPYFDPQTLLDLDAAMSASVRDVIHAHKDTLGIDKIDPAELPRIRAAARREVMRKFLGDNYSDELAGRVEAARLFAVKRYGIPTNQDSRGGQRPDRPDRPDRPERTRQPRGRGAEQTPPAPDVPAPTPEAPQLTETDKERFWEDAASYTASPTFGAMSPESLTRRLELKFDVEPAEARTLAEEFHAKLLADGVLMPEDTVDEHGAVNGQRYVRAQSPDEILARYNLQSENEGGQSAA